MSHSLASLFKAIADSPSENNLRSDVLINIGNYFQAKRSGLFFFSELSSKTEISGLMRLALSPQYNPVLRYLIEHHAPVHEGIVLNNGMWQKICPRSDHAHVMTGPIVSTGQLVGAIGFTRTQDGLPFDAENLADLSAVCLHLSTWLLKSTNDNQVDSITKREKQIFELVAKGLTNAQIGKELWISENSVKQALKRIFRKLEVSSRAEMVAKIITSTGS